MNVTFRPQSRPPGQPTIAPEAHFGGHALANAKSVRPSRAPATRIDPSAPAPPRTAKHQGYAVILLSTPPDSASLCVRAAIAAGRGLTRFTATLAFFRLRPTASCDGRLRV